MIITGRSCLHGRDSERNEQVVVLADVDGTIVASSDEGRLGQKLSEHERNWTDPIEVDDRVVGFLLPYSYDEGRGSNFFFILHLKLLHELWWYLSTKFHCLFLY